jgi:hypothetical protein
MSKPLPKETIQKIREEVLKGKSKYRVAKDMNLSEFIVYSHTSDLPSINLREPCIRGKSLEILQQLLQEGYVHSNINTYNILRRLRRLLPMIQRTQIDGKGIYYLSDKNKIALQAMIKTKHSKIISYQELKSITKVFGVNLDDVEKQRIVRYKENRAFPIIRKKSGGFLSSYKKNQMILDDFIDETALLRKNLSKKRQKVQRSQQDSLLINDDSFVEFCIRNYWWTVYPKVPFFGIIFKS